MTNQRIINKRKLSRLIYLTGNCLSGYRVVLNKFDGMSDIYVNTASVGNALVRELRVQAIALLWGEVLEHKHIGAGYCSQCGHYGDDCTGRRESRTKANCPVVNCSQACDCE